MRPDITPVVGSNPGANRMVLSKATGTYTQQGDRSGTRYRWDKWRQWYVPIAPGPEPKRAPEHLAKIVAVKNISSAAARGELNGADGQQMGAVLHDMVHMPPHYKQFAWEPMRIAMENKLNPLQFNVIKYTHRYALKNGIEDLRKAARSVEMLVKFEQGDPDWWR